MLILACTMIKKISDGSEVFKEELKEITCSKI